MTRREQRLIAAATRWAHAEAVVDATARTVDSKPLRSPARAKASAEYYKARRTMAKAEDALIAAARSMGKARGVKKGSE